jgi:tetratricopeptide (TPR) repeat protein
MGWPNILSRRLNISYGVFAFVFLIRLLSLTRLAGSPFLFPAGGDMYFYDDWAKQILQGRWTDHFAFYGLPLYSYVLAALYKVFGYNPFIPGLLQSGLDAGTATLLYRIAIRIFRNNAEPKPFENRAHVIGLLAAAAWAFFVPAQAYSVILMPTAAGVFVFWFLVWQIVKTNHAPAPLHCLAYGALIGVTAMGIATILFTVPLLLAALLLKPRFDSARPSSWLARGAATALLFLGIAAGTAPCWLHNYWVARDPVLLSAHSGINFWVGNNPEATGYPHFPGLHATQAAMLKDSIDLAQAAAGRDLKRSEVSEFWSAKARAYIGGDFGGWLKLLGRKLVHFWNAFEYDDISIIAKLRGSGVILPGLHFGLVAALAIPGFFFSIGQFPAARWIAAAILLHLAAVLPVFVTERYRLAAVPGLILFAAAGIWMFWEENCARARGRIVAGYIAALAAAAVFVTWPQRDPALWALKFYNSGSQALELQEWPTAQKHLELAHAYAPASTEIGLALGNLWLQQHNLPRAEAAYLAVLRMDPRHKAALSNMGVVALSGKNWGSAANYLRAALGVDPNDGKTHYLYARAQFEAGHTDEALSEIQIALRLRPGQREFEDLYELIQKRRR